MAPSRRRAPFQGAAAQTIIQRLVEARPMRSICGSQRSFCSSSSIPSKLNTTTPPSVNPRATTVANVSVSALLAPLFPSLLAPAIAVPAPASIEELFKIFMQIYIDTVKNQAEAPVQALAPPVSVKLKTQPLKA